MLGQFPRDGTPKQRVLRVAGAIALHEHSRHVKRVIHPTDVILFQDKVQNPNRRYVPHVHENARHGLVHLSLANHVAETTDAADDANGFNVQSSDIDGHGHAASQILVQPLVQSDPVHITRKRVRGNEIIIFGKLDEAHGRHAERRHGDMSVANAPDDTLQDFSLVSTVQVEAVHPGTGTVDYGQRERYGRPDKSAPYRFILTTDLTTNFIGQHDGGVKPPAACQVQITIGVLQELGQFVRMSQDKVAHGLLAERGRVHHHVSTLPHPVDFEVEASDQEIRTGHLLNQGRSKLHEHLKEAIRAPDAGLARDDIDLAPRASAIVHLLDGVRHPAEAKLAPTTVTVAFFAHQELHGIHPWHVNRQRTRTSGLQRPLIACGPAGGRVTRPGRRTVFILFCG